MKVIFDHTIFVQRFGGVSRYVCELAAQLARIEGNEVGVVAPFSSNEYLRSLDPSVLKGPVWNKTFKGSHRLAQIGRAVLTPLYYALDSNADILHETYYSAQAFGQGRRRVLTVYDMNHEVYPGRLDGDIGGTKEKKAAVERADHVICISESTRRELIEFFGTPSEKTSVVHLASSLNIGESSPSRTAREGRPYILFVGGRYYYKNFLRLCRAFAASERLRNDFVLTTFGGGPFTSEERETLSRLGISESVIGLSGGDAELVEAYRGAHLFVYPSEREGFGLPPLEAMSVGCPVVCSDSTSLPEVVGDAALLFDPQSVDEMTSQMEKLAYSDSLRGDLIAKGLERSRMFSWRRCAEETMAVYSQVLGGTR
jgi:glycosyltransferase involved in cell wall biosynthesis